MRRPWLLAIPTAAVLVASAGPAGASEVSVGSPPGSTPRNHQNEPAVAIDAHQPRIAVAGSNDWVDAAPCPRADAVQAGICADPADLDVGISGVYFTFDASHTWTQPAYTGWTAADCDPTAPCTAHEGPIRTLPWYPEHGLVSSGDPAVAIGPKPAPGGFAWDKCRCRATAAIAGPPSRSRRPERRATGRRCGA